MAEDETLLDALAAVTASIDNERDPGARKAGALLALGYVMSLALMSGWTVDEIIALRAWPAKPSTLDP